MNKKGAPIILWAVATIFLIFVLIIFFVFAVATRVTSFDKNSIKENPNLAFDIISTKAFTSLLSFNISDKPIFVTKDYDGKDKKYFSATFPEDASNFKDGQLKDASWYTPWQFGLEGSCNEGKIGVYAGNFNFCVDKDYLKGARTNVE